MCRSGEEQGTEQPTTHTFEDFFVSSVKSLSSGLCCAFSASLFFDRATSASFPIVRARLSTLLCRERLRLPPMLSLNALWLLVCLFYKKGNQSRLALRLAAPSKSNAVPLYLRRASGGLVGCDHVGSFELLRAPAVVRPASMQLRIKIWD